MNSPSLYPDNERPVEAWCDLHNLHVRLADGREVITPLWWYPRRGNAGQMEVPQGKGTGESGLIK